MSEGTLEPQVPSQINKFLVEVNGVLRTGVYRQSFEISVAPRIQILKTLYSSVVVDKVSCEVRQDSMIGTEAGDLIPSGHIYVAIIPTGRNNDASAGTSANVVNDVKNKQSFPLSSFEQKNAVYEFDLTGFELDVAADPRRQQGPVCWLGNSGVAKAGGGNQPAPICSATWRIHVTCTGSSTLW